LPQYRVSGVVIDAADATPIANARVVLWCSGGQLSTRTDAAGAYEFSFRASQPYRIFDGANFLGLLTVGDGAYWEDISEGHWTTVQLLPWGMSDVEHIVRLRPARTLAPGRTMRLSIDADSSLGWNEEWDPWLATSFEILREQFVISVPTDGMLTVVARPEAGGNGATLRCNWCAGRGVQDTISMPVEARSSPIHFSLEIPRGSAPQRYEIQVSLR
jgi:hypothetical protein